MSKHSARHSRSEQVAQEALHDLAVFYASLQDEMARLRNCAPKKSDQAIYRQMEQVSYTYNLAMNDFKEFDSKRVRGALIAFADALKDMMKLIHNSWRDDVLT